MKLFNKIVFFFLVLITQQFYPLVIGSDTVPSRQSFVTFPSADTDNEILGFAVMENGFALENNTTTCDYNAFFPVNSNINLSGGTLTLSRDLFLEDPVSLGVGTIDGNGRSLHFPSNTTCFCVPSELLSTVLTLTASFAINDNVNAVDWSFDDTYLLMGADTDAATTEIQIYWNQGDGTFTFTNGEDVPGNVHSARWEPDTRYFAFGRAGGTELQTRFLNVPAGAIDTIDSDNIGQVRAVSFNRTGTALAVGQQNSTLLRVYPISSGVLGTPVTFTLPASVQVQRNAIDWISSGGFLGVGFNNNAAIAELQVFSSDGTTITLEDSVEVGANSFMAEWHPTLPIFVNGIATGTSRLRLFSFDVNTLTLSTLVAVDEPITVRAASWTDDGAQLAIVTNADAAGDELLLFTYNSTTTVLQQYAGADLGGTSRCVRWSHDKKFIATSDQTSDELKIFAFLEDFLVFKDVNIIFHSDVIFDKAITFDGVVSIEGNGYNLDLSSTGSIVVNSNSSVLLRDLTLDGVGNNNIVLLDSTSSVTLHDVNFQQDADFVLENGFFDVMGDVCVSGTHAFIYNTDVASTVYENASLKFDTDMTFSYAPTSNSNSLLVFNDVTSKLVLCEASLHSTTTGLQLTKGTLTIDGTVDVTSDATVQAEGVMIGDGMSVTNDMQINLGPESVFDVERGIVVYNNLNC